MFLKQDLGINGDQGKHMMRSKGISPSFSQKANMLFSEWYF